MTPPHLTCSHVVTGPPVKMKTMAVVYSVPHTKRARAPPQRLTVASQGRQTSRAALRQRTTHTTDRAPTWVVTSWDGRDESGSVRTDAKLQHESGNVCVGAAFLMR